MVSQSPNCLSKSLQNQLAFIEYSIKSWLIRGKQNRFDLWLYGIYSYVRKTDIEPISSNEYDLVMILWDPVTTTVLKRESRKEQGFLLAYSFPWVAMEDW